MLDVNDALDMDGVEGRFASCSQPPVGLCRIHILYYESELIEDAQIKTNPRCPLFET